MLTKYQATFNPSANLACLSFMQIDQDKLMVGAYYSRKYGMVKNLEQTLCSFETDERMICRDTMSVRDGRTEGAGGQPPNILAAYS